MLITPSKDLTYPNFYNESVYAQLINYWIVLSLGIWCLFTFIR